MRFFIISLLFLYNCSFANIVDFGSHQKKISIKSYKELRDDGIVKQDLDYSCGAASMATLLNNYFYQNISEQQILETMNTSTRASFLDMQMAFAKLGFESQGLALSYDKLTTLKSPVIVYVKHRKTDHFSVLRGINKDFVWLADPSLGNRILSKTEFIKLWHTRDNPNLSGKVLAVIPKNNQVINQSYFSHHIKQPNQQSLKMIGYKK